MSLSGVHLLLTYKCNAECEHCFLSCGPRKNGLATPSQLRKYLSDAQSPSSKISYFFIEGGEPFLYREELRSMVSEITEAGYWVGALTNGFWASSPEQAKKVLEPVVAAGLKSLGVSSDDYHDRYVGRDRAALAVETARSLGVNSDIMACGRSDLVCRGRAAASPECATGLIPWEECTECDEPLPAPSRVHIGPEGEIHLCQGLLLGERADRAPLDDIFARWEKTAAEHPIVGPLLQGGPAGLGRWAAAAHGFVPRDTYADGCLLCYEARSFLRDRHPEFLGPAQVYGD